MPERLKLIILLLRPDLSTTRVSLMSISLKQERVLDFISNKLKFEILLERNTCISKDLISHGRSYEKKERKLLKIRRSIAYDHMQSLKSRTLLPEMPMVQPKYWILHLNLLLTKIGSLITCDTLIWWGMCFPRKPLTEYLFCSNWKLMCLTGT